MGAVTVTRATESKAYLFHLDTDMSENENILMADCSCYDEEVIERVAEKAITVLEGYVADEDLFMQPMRNFLSEKSQIVLRTFDGEEFKADLEDLDEDVYFLAPFLENDEYFHAVWSALEIHEATDSLASLYLEAWTVPDAMASSAVAMFTKIIVVLIVAAALMAVCCTVVMYYCNKNRRKRYGPYTYTPIKDAEMEEAIRDQRTEVYIY